MADLSVSNQGSIFLLRGVSDAGSTWLAEHIPDDAQHFGGAVVVEHRFIADITAGAIEDGLEVE